LYTLPWSGQKRDFYGYFHAFYVYIALVKYLGRVRSRSTDELQRAQNRLLYILRGLIKALPDFEASTEFTPQGRQLLENLAKEVRAQEAGEAHMGMFDASSYPEAGVGLEYHLPRRRAQDDRSEDGLDPTVERILAEGLPHFDYVEFQPTHCILQPRLLDVSARVPSLLHSSSLSLGSVGIAMDREFLNMTRRLCDKTRSPWLAEHISWSRFHGGDTQHFILPTLAQEVADTVVANAIELRELTATLLVLENAPRLFSLPGGEELPEGEFISSVVERSGAGFLLDLDSAMATARTQGYDLNDYLRSLPLDRLIEVHTGHPQRDWEILRQLFASSPVKAITLEWDISRRTDDAELLTLINRARKRPWRRMRRLLCDSGRAPGSASGRSRFLFGIGNET
jgi:uncharacterized protein (UPF0276 family)